MSSTQQHWQQLYDSRRPEQLGWYQQSPDFSLSLFDEIGADPSLAVIDAGCGASMLVDSLIQQGYRNITLLDLSAAALETVKTRLGKNGNIPNYRTQDITLASFPARFDIWHDRAVFHFLTEAQDRKNYMATLARSLTAQGHAIIGTFSMTGPDSCSGLQVVQYDEARMNAELPDDLELLKSRPSTHITPSGKPQQYLYFIIRHKYAR
ncbi:MAG: class I SAM-dependent methyltransferase [Gammaproteobacteria bacterium]|nr:class I SAM-dependent methyltransferase [Gammaproteobacteria bacterium]